MKLHQHEQWIKNNIEGLENSVDSNALWADLKEYVPKKEKSRKGIIILFSGLAVFLTAILIFLFYPSFEQLEGNPESHFVEQIYQIPNIDFNEKEAQIPNKEITIETTSSNKDILKDRIISHDINKNAPATPRNESLYSVIKIEDNKQNNSIDLSNHLFESSVKSKNPFISNSLIPFKNNVVGEKDNQMNTTDKILDKRYSNEINGNTIIKETIDFTLLKSVHLSMLSNDLLLKDLSLKKIIKRKKPKIKVGLIQGMNFKNDVLQSSNQEYNELYNSISTDLAGNFSSIFFQYSFTDKWSLWTSLNFNQSVTRLTYEFEKRTTETTQGIRQYVIGTDNSTSEFSGEIISHNIIKANGTWHEFENNIDNSVVLQYSLWNKNRIQAKIGAGIDLSLYSKLKGSSLDHNAENYIINSNQTIKYKSSIINPIYLFQLDYRLTPKYSIGVIGLFTTKNRYIDHIYNSSILKRTSYNIGLSCNYILL